MESLASKTHGSVSPEALTSVVTKDTPIEAPTNTTNTVSSFIAPLTYVSTTVSWSADPSTSFTCSLNEGSKSSATIDLTSEEPKIKRRRIKHDALFRAEVIQKKEEGATTAELINIYKSFNLDKTKVSKWMKNKNSIIQAASEQQKKKLFKIRPGTKYQSLIRDLLGNFKDARSKGLHVDFNWFWSKGRKIYKEQTGDENAVWKKHVIANFIKRNNLKQLKIQRSKRSQKEYYRSDMEKWHSALRERAIRTSAGEPDYDKKWGRYLPLQRFNMYQSPLPFARDTTKTYEQRDKRSKENRNKKVRTSQPNTGDSKRVCTLNVCFRPTGEQTKLAIIFRWKIKRLSDVEKASWDKDVDVYFQKNAWADTEFCLDWSKETFNAIVKGTGSFILFFDNLETHGLVYLMPPTYGNQLMVAMLQP